MRGDASSLPVEAAVPAAIPKQAKRLPLQRPRCCLGGFTLAELLVSVGVLVLLVILASQLLNSAANITTLGHKRMDADAQARQLLDRMAVDFAQMVKRSDVDYYVKSSAAAPFRRVLQPGNDQIAFYCTVPGYYPTSGSQSPVSLAAYRINSDSTSSAYNKMQRMGRGLLWNAATPSPPPVVFLPIPLASPLALPSPTPSPIGTPLPTPTPTAVPPTPTANPAWPDAASATDNWPDSEIIGPQVFRFEYYYLLKNGTLSGIPWDTNPSLLPLHTDVTGMQDVAAIVVNIAVIDPKSKVLVDTVDPTAAKIKRLNGADGSPPALVDYAAGMIPGQLLAQWRAALDANTVGLPRPAISGIRLYERYFYLSPPTLITP